MRPLDTANKHAVTAMRDEVVILGDVRALARGVPPADALELAAWLIVGAELADPGLASGSQGGGISAGLAIVAELAARIRAT